MIAVDPMIGSAQREAPAIEFAFLSGLKFAYSFAIMTSLMPASLIAL
jgi:hypothetical protein